MKNIFNYKLLTLCFVFALFAFGLFQLLKLRFEQGDIYPAYSSLRTDPLGSKALYESVGKVKGLKAAQNFKAWKRVSLEEPTTVFILGIHTSAATELLTEKNNSLLSHIAAGHRLVIGVNPHIRARDLTENGEEDIEEEPSSSDEVDDPLFTEIQGLNIQFATEVLLGGQAQLSRDLSPRHSRLNKSILWRETYPLESYDEKWQPIYKIADNPVILERPFGKGSIVLLTDSYLFSNEALLQKRETSVLTWLLSGTQSALFNETHLGVIEPQGIALLMRKYRLGGLALALGLVAFLFIWQNLAPLVPALAYREHDTDSVLTNRTLQSGYRDLLKRCVPSKELIKTCLDEWSKTHLRTPTEIQKWKKPLAQAEDCILAETKKAKRERSHLKLYQEIRDILNQANTSKNKQRL